MERLGWLLLVLLCKQKIFHSFMDSALFFLLAVDVTQFKSCIIQSQNMKDLNLQLMLQSEFIYMNLKEMFFVFWQGLKNVSKQ